MPTINLGNQNNTSNANPPSNQAFGNWQQPWDDSWSDTPQQTNSSPKRLTPQERVAMIEAVFQEVLLRKPDTRDINYYKYSTLSEEEIRKQLISGNEHKRLIEDGRDYKKVKDRAVQSETRVKMLEGQIKDQVEEFKELTILLKEKNAHIQKLRQDLNDKDSSHPFIHREVPPVQAPNVQQEPTQYFNSPTLNNTNSDNVVKKISKKIKGIIDPFL